MSAINPNQPKGIQSTEPSKTETEKSSVPSTTIARAKKKVTLDFPKVSNQSILNRKADIGTFSQKKNKAE